MLVTDETKAVAQRTYDFLITNPDKHNQALWVGYKNGNPRLGPVNEENFCDTTLCAAGAVVFLEQGLEGVNRILDVERYDEDDDNLDFDDVAAGYLGLDNMEAYSLFYDTGNEGALDALLAIAQGDEEKFIAAVDS